MIPVPNGNLAMIAWSKMEKADCHPCGVLAYSNDASSAVATYMRGRGMETADDLFRAKAGNRYAFIATDCPTDTWCDYAEEFNLLWWQWFGASFKQWQSAHSPTPEQTTTEIIEGSIEINEQSMAETVQTSAQTNAPVAVSGATTVTTDETAIKTDEVVRAVEHELYIRPDVHLGNGMRGQPIRTGLLKPNPVWRWYYRGPYSIAQLFRIDSSDVPCLKVRVSFQNKSGGRFPLDGVAANQMEQRLQDIATRSDFTAIVQAY